MTKQTLTVVALVILTGIGATTCFAQGYRGRGSQRQMGNRPNAGARWQNQSRWDDSGWQNYPQQSVQQLQLQQQQLNDIGRDFQFQLEMDNLRRQRDEARNQAAVQNFFLEGQRQKLKQQQWQLEQQKQKQQQMGQQQSGTKPYPRLERPRTAEQNFIDARKELGRELSNGRQAAGRELSNGRKAAGRELSNGRQAVGRELSNGRKALGREATNAGRAINNGFNSIFGR